MQIFSSVTYIFFRSRELLTCPTLFFFFYYLNLVATLVNGHGQEVLNFKRVKTSDK